MSRLIVKNLPSGIKEDKLRNHFGKIGSVTDCSLKYTKSGVFRKFAFIGFKTEQEAQAALKQFNKTFIDASKIVIEVAKDFGDTNKPRAWSKYAKDSSAGQANIKASKDGTSNKEDKKKKKKKTDHSIVDELLDDVKDDPKFTEFLEVHQNVSVKPVWTNDGVRPADEKSKVSDHQMSESHEEADYSEKEQDSDEDVAEEKNKTAVLKGLSDLDYLKSKVSSKDKGEVGDSDDEQDSSDNPVSAKKLKDKKNQEEKKTLYMLKLKGIPAKCGEKAVKEFFNPLKLAKLHVAKNAAKRPIGIAYVGFETENDLEQGLRRNKNFIGGKRIFLKKCDNDQVDIPEPEKPRPWEIKNDSEECEGIAETGRLFVRNLAYSCTEEDLEAEFKQFGPLTEVKCPVDSLTKKVKGFAFITYMMPEHAVRAYSALDGKVFQGRMLHILPAKEMKDTEEESTEGSSYKKKKSAKEKASALKSYNWNSLFLGANAVADVLAEKYKTSKSDILDTELKGSLGVRLALGETQVVQETRDFLTDNGVALDSFSQPNAPRSKTVILVKNLPAKTDVTEIETVFSPFGSLGRVLLPPSGISAIVEFLIPTEAKAAFTKLAYRKFHHVPLFLEWAPMEVFTSPAPEKSKDKSKDKNTEKEGTEETIDDKEDLKEETKKEKAGTEDSDDDDEEETVGSVLFVKNLNFDTTDENLKQHFSQCKGFKTANVAKKKDMKNPGQMLSMGYGFVEFKSPDGAQETMKHMQHTDLDGHTLELKVSNRTTARKKEFSCLLILKRTYRTDKMT
ncbi:probable RNA-binding protein 19 isoform X2 [Mercenaria mercenaria]|uniref:probable RNA-binding protein 19 isoform X2 n=1 Tax=Mercenaria mercenaria TaxID=6596 RepID=UPI00234F9939|nr:probable RNA-binding protein 19 isoform X2 [Mercenaria mercenaria]